MPHIPHYIFEQDNIICSATMTEEAKPKVALITGITGQDGSYLAELLLEKGYEVRKDKKLLDCL
jgi:hypothetical protein